MVCMWRDLVAMDTQTQTISVSQPQLPVSLTKPSPPSQGSGTLLSFSFCSPMYSRVTRISYAEGGGLKCTHACISIDMQIVSVQLAIFYTRALTTSLQVCPIGIAIHQCIHLMQGQDILLIW